MNITKEEIDQAAERVMLAMRNNLIRPCGYDIEIRELAHAAQVSIRALEIVMEEPTCRPLEWYIDEAKRELEQEKSKAPIRR